MKSFEIVYKELEYLLIQKLPESIEKINKEHNDGIILKTFENKSLEENCIKTPSFTFNIEETEYSEKDRLIENIVFSISLEIKLQPHTEKTSILFWRYVESIGNLIDEYESDNFFGIYKTEKNKIFIRITLCG